ncbi:DUF4870 family protein [Sutterella sp.]|uniref:DUF4870 family protein n=1 Tax=Sutterella sp. TaxID=1981025 RepID=UPI002600D89F|nr:hypothetical protein [uncultured Sutterella sp.]
MSENRRFNREVEDVVEIEHRERPADYVEPASGTVTVAHIVYALHTISILIGLLTAGLTIVGAFVFSGPSILAVIINYIFRSDARDTYVESHFSWQIRTFWFALLWMILVYVISVPLLPFGFGLVTLVVGLLALGIWVAYRILIGWKRLVRREPMPMP